MAPGDLERAGREIVRGASFDNNIICVDEKTTIVVDSAADRLWLSDSGNDRVVVYRVMR